MSTFNDKVIATNAFLLNRIGLRRVTNHEELQRVVGQMLFLNGRRSNPFPVDREKIIDALAAVDDLSINIDIKFTRYPVNAKLVLFSSAAGEILGAGRVGLVFFLYVVEKVFEL